MFVMVYKEGSHKKIPVMLVGNKTDMREEMIREKKRVVKEQDGQRLARVCFILSHISIPQNT